MLMEPECVPCILGRLLFESNLVDPSKGKEVMVEAIKILNEEFEKGGNSARIASRLHRKTYDIIGSEDPYYSLKKRSNEVALSILPEAERFVEASEDRFLAATVAAVAGNVLDFGIRSGSMTPEKLAENFSSMLAEGLGHDDTKRIKEYIKPGARVLYFTDNCGEIVFDKLLMREVRGMGADLTLVVKGKPVLTDATMEDVKELGMEEEADSVLTTGTDAIGIDLNNMPEELKDALDTCDIIIAKGMANYEAFSDSDYRPIAYMMKTKCRPVADSIGLPKGISAAKIVE